MSVLVSFLLTLRDAGRSRVSLQLEVLALRHQLQVLKRAQAHRLGLTRIDRLLWVWFARAWQQWRDALVIVKRDGYRLAAQGLPPPGWPGLARARTAGQIARGNGFASHWVKPSRG